MLFAFSITDVRQPRGPHDGGIAVSAKRRPFYNENNSSINRGALGLSQEKMALIRDKKEEIEKVINWNLHENHIK